MKNLNYYLNLDYEICVREDKEDGGYVAWFPGLPGCITCSEKREDLLRMLFDAKEQWLVAAIESGYPIAEPHL